MLFLGGVSVHLGFSLNLQHYTHIRKRNLHSMRVLSTRYAFGLLRTYDKKSEVMRFVDIDLDDKGAQEMLGKCSSLVLNQVWNLNH